MRAIVYAAGISARMKEHVKDGLKGLTKLGEESLIQHQLNWISFYKPKEIIIVIGLQHQRYIDEIGLSYNGVPVRYVYNPDYKTKGNMLSLWHAKDFCDDDVIFTTSDLLCDKRDIDLFINNNSSDKILIDKYNKELFEVSDPVKVKVEENKITKIRKKINEIDRVDGISIGVYQFSKYLMNRLINCIEKKIDEGDDDLSLYYSIDEVLHFAEVRPVYTKESIWLDIDTPEELTDAKKLLEHGKIKVIKHNEV